MTEVGCSTCNTIRPVCQAELAAHYSLSVPHTWNLIKRGELPEGIRVGTRRRWFLSDVDAWLKERAEQEATA